MLLGDLIKILVTQGCFGKDGNRKHRIFLKPGKCHNVVTYLLVR